MQPQTAFDRRSDVAIVDVRDPQEWDEGHVEGSRHIPLSQLASRLSELPGGVAVVAVCRTGRRSGRAVEVLRSAGIEADHVEGGLTAWSEAGLPLVTADGRPGTVAPAGTGHTDDPDRQDDQGTLHPRTQRRVMELLAAVAEHFGDREPSEEEARDFFRQLLAAEGRAPEEIDQLLS